MAKTLCFSFGILFLLHVISSQNVPRFRTEMIADGIYSASNMENSDHSMIILTTEGVMVIETFSSRHSSGLLEAVKNLTSMKIKQVLVTHNHRDHASGTKVFQENDNETTIICHEEAWPAIKANLGPDQVMPTANWTGVKEVYNWGNMTIEYHYLGINHGNGMTVVLIPQPQVAYIADIVSPGLLLFSIAPDTNLHELNRTLYELRDNFDFDKAVYSHNILPESWKGGTKQDVSIFIEYIEDLQAETIKYLSNSSIPFFQVPNLVKLPKYENFTFYNTFLVPNVWRIITEEIVGPHPWRMPYDKALYEKINSNVNATIVVNRTIYIREDCNGAHAQFASHNFHLPWALILIALIKHIFHLV